ncbi:MAG: hypothetical protein AW07_02928 [Candidatus Accumulibacter sp. SK-11]|nr:MAG: hypothetical protein AW07_02928 [Candidatus Accumulibacter sp. SK-11]
MIVALEDADDPLHVALCLGIGRHAAIAIDRTLPGIVGGSNQTDVTFEIGQQPAQVSQSAAQVLLRIERLLDVEACRGIGNQLHQPLRILVRQRRRIEIGFGADHRQRQARTDAVLRRQLLHETDDLFLQLGTRHDDVLAVIEESDVAHAVGNRRRGLADEALHPL